MFFERKKLPDNMTTIIKKIMRNKILSIIELVRIFLEKIAIRLGLMDGFLRRSEKKNINSSSSAHDEYERRKTLEKVVTDKNIKKRSLF
jgi:hypothetical protein